MDPSDLHLSLETGCATLAESPNDGVREYLQQHATLALGDLQDVPRELFVQASGSQCCYSGSYAILLGVISQGFPVWRHRGGCRRLYVGVDGHWCIGDEDSSDSRSVSRRIFSPTPHGGELPTRASTEKWFCFDDRLQKGVQDVYITLSSVCQFSLAQLELHVTASAQYLPFSGAYKIVDGEYANGFRVWRQAGGNRWLYTLRDGRWCFCGEEVRLLKGFTTCGCMSHADPHGGVMPEHLEAGKWRHRDVGTQCFIEDESIAVSAVFPRVAPRSVYLESPLGQQQFAGEYSLVAGDAANGFPVWQQSGGRRYLYSCPDGHWCFGEEDARRDDFRGTAGPICTDGQHGCAMPDEAGPWLRHDQIEKRHLKDAALNVQATSWWSSSSPICLQVSCSPAFACCTGRYDLAPAVSTNGFPAWRRRGGGWWLYTTPTGHWALGPGHPRGVPATASSAVGRLYHPNPHGGLSPDTLSGRWARHDLETGAAVTDVVVSVSSRGRWCFVSWFRCCRRHRARSSNTSGIDAKAVLQCSAAVSSVSLVPTASSERFAISSVVEDASADAALGIGGLEGSNEKEAAVTMSLEISNQATNQETQLEVKEVFEELICA